MIKEIKPLSISEASEFVRKKDVDIDVSGFMKKFTKFNSKKAKELRKNIEDLNLIKVDAKHASKMIDLIPETKEDLNKIFTDVSLDENETNKLLEEIKKFR